jgi:4-hydroxybenzoyl-CoA thioesterase
VVSGADGIRWKARQTVVATSTASHRAIPWPDDIRNALEEHVRAEDAISLSEPDLSARPS